MDHVQIIRAFGDAEEIKILRKYVMENFPDWKIVKNEIRITYTNEDCPELMDLEDLQYGDFSELRNEFANLNFLSLVISEYLGCKLIDLYQNNQLMYHAYWNFARLHRIYSNEWDEIDTDRIAYAFILSDDMNY